MAKQAHKGAISNEAKFVLDTVHLQAPTYRLHGIPFSTHMKVYVDSSNTAAGLLAQIGNKTIFQTDTALPELKDPSSTAKEARGVWAIIAKAFSRIRMEAESLSISNLPYLFDNANLVLTINNLPAQLHTFTQIYAHRIHTLCHTYGGPTCTAGRQAQPHT